MSERHACGMMGLGRSTHRYRAQQTDRDGPVRARLKELAARRMRFGYRRLTAMLVREGMPVNHKRVYRLYREEGLVRIRQRRKIRWSGVMTNPAATRPNQRWSMDFVSDCVSTGKVIRMLTLVDHCTRECPVIEVDTSLGGLRVRRVLDRIASERGLPEGRGRWCRDGHSSRRYESSRSSEVRCAASTVPQSSAPAHPDRPQGPSSSLISPAPRLS